MVPQVSQRSVVRPRSAASASVRRAATLSAPSISSRVTSSTGKLTASHHDSCRGLPRKSSTCGGATPRSLRCSWIPAIQTEHCFSGHEPFASGISRSPSVVCAFATYQSVLRIRDRVLHVSG